ncbi:MAG: methyltransferase domain-containing protein [Candidatus Aegiribacteria sp.]|nr:methyltransferase domain-containing protein [Candidatus Aegiribacteria sp.]
MDWSRFPREKTDCILCGSNFSRLLSVQKTWPVVRCSECGLVYLSERPVEKALTDMYSRAYYEDGDVGYRGYLQTFEKYHDTFMKIFSGRHRDLLHHARGRRLLEVGCAYGFLLDYLDRRGWDVQGVEISPLSSEYARDILGLDVYTGSVESADLEEHSYDVILLLDVLEHLHRPSDILRRIRKLLSPDGILVVQCPWELYHWEEIAEAILRGKRPGTIEPDSIPAHLYFFQPRTLDAVLKNAGFRIYARQSGNYGSIRRLIEPPEINRGNPIERFSRFVYFRLGLQRFLYSAARLLHLGNGMIRYAIADEDGQQ